jgi:membrane-associated phospholipid phosphatase
MILATPVDGGHYLVDVLAGAALAIALIAISRVRHARGLNRARHDTTIPAQQLLFRNP